MNRVLTPFTNKDIVAAQLKPVTDLLIPGLGRSCRLSNEYFRMNGLPFDAGLHSHLTRHRLLHFLLQNSIHAANEHDDNGYEATGQSLCGIVIETMDCTLRILKNSGHKQELPSASTDSRIDFYQNNFGFSNASSEEAPSLSLVGIWTTDEELNLSSFALVCPYGLGIHQRPEHRWWHSIQFSQQQVNKEQIRVLSPEPRLDEITPKASAIIAPVKTRTLQQSERRAKESNEGPSVI